MNNTSKLIDILLQTPKSKNIPRFINLVEDKSCVDITKQSDLLRGVWELRWSSSKSPLLNYSPLFDNFQILVPERGAALNLLRPKGLFGNLLSTKIFAKLEVVDHKRLNVTFQKAGLIGPQIFGKSIAYFSEIKETQKGWLDTTVLTNKLRVCRGYKGTTFALLKRDDFLISDFF